MWVFAGRNRPLDQTNASIVKNEVRMGWEVDPISAKTNSTSIGYEEKRSEKEHWTGATQRTWNVLRPTPGSGRRFCFSEFNYRIRAIAPRNGTLDRNTVSGWDSRADISGNARHFCDGEFNYTGYDGKRQDWNTGPKRRKERKTFCVLFGKWTSVLWAQVQLQDTMKRAQKWLINLCSICLYLPK